MLRIYGLLFFFIFATNLLASEFLKDTSYLVFRNNFNTLNKNQLRLEDFTLLEQNKLEIGIVAQDTLLISNNFHIVSQFRVFNEGNYYYNNSYANNVRIYIDEAYGSFSFKEAFFSLGRKKVQNQISYFFPVLDVFSRKKRRDIGFFDKDIENSGQDLLDFQLSNDNNSFYMAYTYDFQNYDRDLIKEKTADNKEDIPKNSNLLLKVSRLFYVTNTDLVLLYVNDNDRDNNHSNNTFGFSINQNFGNNLIVYTEYKTLQYNRVNNIYKARNDRWVFDYNLGANYTFSNNINILVEYYYNEGGYSKSEWHNLMEDINNVAPVYKYYEYVYTDSDYLKRQYLAWRLSGLSIEGYQFDLSQIVGLEDFSFNTLVSVEKDLRNNIKIYLQGGFLNGNSSSEFNTIPYDYNLLIYIKYFI